MRSFMYEMNEYKKKYLESEVLSCEPEKLAFFESEYDRLVEEGRTVFEQVEVGICGFKCYVEPINR